MMSSNNILSPANGDPIIVPTQDVVLGLYYMTRELVNVKGEGMVFANTAEVHRAYDNHVVDLHAKVKVRINEVEIDDVTKERRPKTTIIDTTVGRALLSEIMPVGLPFALINSELTKKAISRLINAVLPQPGSQGHRRLRRPADVHRFPLRHACRHFDRHRRHEDPGRKARDPRSRRKRCDRNPGAVRFGSGHGRRALQQSGRHLVAHQRTGCRRDDERHRHRQGEDRRRQGRSSRNR